MRPVHFFYFDITMSFNTDHTQNKIRTQLRLRKGILHLTMFLYNNYINTSGHCIAPFQSFYYIIQQSFCQMQQFDETQNKVLYRLANPDLD